MTHVGDAEVADGLEAFVQQLQTAAKGPIFRMKARPSLVRPFNLVYILKNVTWLQRV